MNASSQASDELVVNAAVVRCEQEERVGVTPNATTIDRPARSNVDCLVQWPCAGGSGYARSHVSVAPL